MIASRSRVVRLADAAKGIAPDIADELIHSSHEPLIVFLPVEIFLPRLGGEDDIHVYSFNFFRMPLPLSSDSIDFNSRFAFAGERSRYAVS